MTLVKYHFRLMVENTLLQELTPSGCKKMMTCFTPRWTGNNIFLKGGLIVYGPWLYTEDAGLPFFDRASVTANGYW